MFNRLYRSTVPSVGAVIRDKSYSSVDLPAQFRPIIPTTSPCSTSNETSFERPELFRSRNMMESLERRRHRIDDCIAEGMIFFLRAAKGVFLAEIAPQMAMLSEDIE